MTLQELIGQLTEADLAETDDDLTVFASEPWTADSDATATPNPDDIARPDPQGRTYLLEISLIHDVLETWSAHHAGARPSPQQACEAVIYYAEHDAYLIPDDNPA
ncbi:hypothetical protein [Actinomadura rudentiformis]|uniref:Uncharacterized protein n=1 Tax=Actinomadura rudentiformis TaxID=359158 RepID=A0A6H9YPJ5_9ACTN|nr:hypothetical protein [Actinomadura rudentiformis]KAB2346896.1 hypothetical protein F8566_22100 [Actinomadura rudentiformis]